MGTGEVVDQKTTNLFEDSDRLIQRIGLTLYLPLPLLHLFLLPIALLLKFIDSVAQSLDLLIRSCQFVILLQNFAIHLCECQFELLV